MDVLTRNSKSFAGSNLRNEGRRIAMKHFNNYKIVLNQMELFQQPLVKTFGEQINSMSTECLKVLAGGDLVIGYQNTIEIWDVQTATCKKTWTAYPNDYERVFFLDQLPSGELVTLSGESEIKIWDLRTGNIIDSTAYFGMTSCLKVLPSGDWISTNRDGTIKIYDVKSGKCVKSLESHGLFRIERFELFPSGEFVSGYSDGTIKIWDLQSERCLNTLKHTVSADDRYPASVTCLQALTSGELVSGSADSTVRVWDVKTGNCLKTLIGHTGWVCGLQVLPLGDLASGSHDGTIRIWHVQTGECIRTLEHASLVEDCLHLLPSGELVSGSWDHTIKIWNIPNRKHIPKLFGSFHCTVTNQQRFWHHQK